MRKKTVLPYLVVLPYIFYLMHKEYGVTIKSGLLAAGIIGTIVATAFVYANNRKLVVPFYVISLIILAMTFFL